MLMLLDLLYPIKKDCTMRLKTIITMLNKMKMNLWKRKMRKYWMKFWIKNI